MNRLAWLFLGAVSPCAPLHGQIPFAAVAGEARYALSASTGTMFAGLDPASQDIVARAMARPDGTLDDALWSRIAAGALQTRREAGARADTLWFNPVLDCGLVIRWTQTSGLWRVAAAAAITGEQLRNQTAGDRIAWPVASATLPAALRASALASATGIDAANWDALLARGNTAIALRRAAVAEVSIEAMTATPGYADSLALLHELLSTGDPAAHRLPAPLVRSLNEMGEGARLRLRAVSAYRLDDGWMVAMQTPDAPGFAWLATFADPAPGQPALPVQFNVVALDGGVQ